MLLCEHALGLQRVNGPPSGSPPVGPVTHQTLRTGGVGRSARCATTTVRGAAAPACAEMFSDTPESTMFAVEAAHVAGAAEVRRREFATVRHCARSALRCLGVPVVPILPDADRAPRWPAGVVGSLTHCPGYRAAVVARSDELRTIGIDAEPHAAVPGDALELVLRDEERARLVDLADVDPEVRWDRVLFCAKEAVFKAWFPLTRRWLDFTEVSTTLRRDGTFLAELQVPVPRADLRELRGRWVVGRGLVVAATWVGGRPRRAGGASRP